LTKAHLVFLFPVENIINPTKTAHVDVLARLDQHVGSGDYEGQGWFARVLTC
jgi:hypothetical protein